MSNKGVFFDENKYNPVTDQEDKKEMFDGVENGTVIRKKEAMSEKMQFFVKPTTKAKIVAFAESQGVSYADVVRTLMEDFIEKNGL